MSTQLELGARPAPPVGTRASFEIWAPIRTTTGMNAWEGWWKRNQREGREAQAIRLFYWQARPPHLAPPFRVILIRSSPGPAPDDDNLGGGLKTVRDAVTICLGLFKLSRKGKEIALDGPKDPIRFEYQSTRGPWGVHIIVDGQLPGPEDVDRRPQPRVRKRLEPRYIRRRR